MSLDEPYRTVALALEIRLAHEFVLDNGGSPEPNRRKPVKLDGIVAECLRQMEWARGIGYRHAEDAREDDSLYLKVNRPPTTIAPEGWKP